MKIGKKILIAVLFLVFVLWGIFPEVGISQNLYYSVNSGDFGTLSNWNTDSTGAGSNPSSIENNAFIIRSGHSITSDDDYDIFSLKVRDGGLFDASTFNLNVSDTLVLDDGTINFGSGTVEIGGDFSISDGTLNAGDGIISLISDMTITNSPDFNSETSTFSFNSTNAYTISSSIDIEFYNVIHRPGTGGTRTLTFSGANFSITKSLERGNRSLAIYLSNGATLSYTTGATLIYSPETVSMTVSDVEWPDLNGPENVTLNGSTNLNLGSNKTIDGTLLLIQGSGNFVISPGNTLTINGSLDRRTSGSRGITGTVAYSSTGSTLRYQTSGATIIGAEWPENFPPEDLEMTITGQPADSLVSSASINRTLSRDLVLNVGKLSLGAGTLTVLGDVMGSDISGSAVIKDNTTLRLGNGTGNSEQQNVIGSITLNKLEIDKAESGASADELTVLMTGTSAFTFTPGGKLNINAGILNLNGNSRFGADPDTLIVNANGILKTGGTRLDSIDIINASSGRIEFTGSSPEILPSDITIGTVEVNNSAGVSTSVGTLTVADELVLTNGVITTSSSNILLMSVGATISGTPGNTRMIQGPLQKEFSAVGSFLFPVGSDGSPSKFYRPATFEYTAGTFTGNNIVEIEYSRSAFTPKQLPTGISQIANTSHYILKSVSNTPSGFEYYITGTYEDGNFTPESRNRALVETSTSYSVADTNNVNDINNTVRSGIFTTFPVGSQFVVFGAGGATLTWDGGDPDDNLWSSPQNWDPDSRPTSTDDVVIYLGETVVIADTTAAVAQTLVIGDGSNSPTLVMNGTIRIYQNNATSLTVNDAATLIVNNEDGIRFGSSGGYNSTLTNFTNGSTVEYQAGTVQADSYGNLIVNGATGSSTSGTFMVNGSFEKQNSNNFTAYVPVTVTGTYTNQAGTSTFNESLTMNGSSFVVNGGSIGGTVTFAGTSAQNISGTATATFNNMTINNSNGLSLNTSVQVNGTLSLTSGIVSTASNIFTLGSNATVAEINNSSYVEGNVASIYTTNLSSRPFPIGSQNRQRMLNLQGNASTGSGALVCNIVAGNAASVASVEYPLEKVSEVRYYTFTNNSGVTLNFNKIIDFRINDDDGVGLLVSNATLRFAGNLGATGSWLEIFLDPATPNTSVIPCNISSLTNDTPVPIPTSNTFYITLATTNADDNSLPVDLVAFNAIGKYGKVLLTWQTASEVNNSGFEIYRATSENGTYELLNQQLIPGHGNSTTAHYYEYLDTEVEEQTTYYYKLYSRDFNGKLNVYEKISTATVLALPKEFRIAQNYPNPFNPTTRLSFDVARESRISIEVYNMLGQKIRTLLDNERLEPGVYDHLIWDAKDDAGNSIANGIYYLVFTAKDHNFRQVRKMVFMK